MFFAAIINLDFIAQTLALKDCLVWIPQNIDLAKGKQFSTPGWTDKTGA
ncbi:MAG: hypothetical protein R3235_01360 [Altererythrobacter ishigakiensis]|nr:hypothetical protein [Altererythrobacter ishigakiensis]